TSLSGPGPLPWTYTYLRTSWISGKSVPVPCSTGQHGTDIAHGRLTGRHNVLLRAGRVRPHHLVTGDADLSRFLQGDLGHGAGAAEDDPVGLGDLDAQPGRLLVEPRRLDRQVLHCKAVLGRLGVQDGQGFPPIVR